MNEDLIVIERQSGTREDRAWLAAAKAARLQAERAELLSQVKQKERELRQALERIA